MADALLDSSLSHHGLKSRSICFEGSDTARGLRKELIAVHVFRKINSQKEQQQRIQQNFSCLQYCPTSFFFLFYNRICEIFKTFQMFCSISGNTIILNSIYNTNATENQQYPYHCLSKAAVMQQRQMNRDVAVFHYGFKLAYPVRHSLLTLKIIE